MFHFLSIILFPCSISTELLNDFAQGKQTLMLNAALSCALIIFSLLCADSTRLPPPPGFQRQVGQSAG